MKMTTLSAGSNLPARLTETHFVPDIIAYFGRARYNFERARLHVQAAVQAANPEPIESIFISVLIEMLREEKHLRARMDGLEKELRDAKK